MLFRCPLFQYILTLCDAGDTEAILPLIALCKDEKDLFSWTEVAYRSSAASILLYYWIIWKIWQFLIKSSSWNFLVEIKSICVDMPVCYVTMLRFECFKEFFIRRELWFECISVLIAKLTQIYLKYIS